MPKDVPGWWDSKGQAFNDTLVVSEQAHVGFEIINGSIDGVKYLHEKYGTAMYLAARAAVLSGVTRDWLREKKIS